MLIIISNSIQSFVQFNISNSLSNVYSLNILYILSYRKFYKFFLQKNFENSLQIK